MSTNQRITKSRSEIRKNRESMYKSSFGDLPDGTIYRDPAGWKTGEPVELQKDRWDQMANEPVAELDGQSIVEKWNSLQRKGFSLQQTTDEIAKSLDTGGFTLPLDIIPEVFVVNPEQTPLADMMTRVATQDDEVVATPVDADPEPSFGLEAPTVAEDAEGNYQYEFDQPEYGDLRYEIEGLGLATRLSDKLILSSANLRNAESTQEQSLVRGMRKKTERQILFGTDAGQGGDENGYEGLADFASGDGTVIDFGDPENFSPADAEEATREILDEAEFAGAPREDLAFVCDFDWHKKLRTSLQDNVRYSDPGQEIGAGFEALDFDGVPVMKSHAFPRLEELADDTTQNVAYAVNMNATYLSVLRETSVQPLARVGPQERMAVDQYATCTSEAPEHIIAGSVTTPA